MKYFVIASLICLTAKHAFAVSYHEIRLVSPGGSLPSAAKYTSDASFPAGDVNKMKNVGSTFSSPNVASVCAVGMWAFYTNQDFGEGTEDTTNSTVVRGYDPASCLSVSAYPIFRKTNSVRFIGQANKDLNGLVIYSEPLFMGGKYEYYEAAGVLPSGTTPVQINLGTSPGVVTGVKLSSIAITGPPTASNYWRVCGDAECLNNVVCIKTAGHRGLYINRNTLTDPNVKWPTIVRAIMQATSETCDSDIHTPPVTIIPRIIGKASNANSKTLEIY